MQGQARMTFAGPMPATTYQTLGECQKAGSIVTGRPPDLEGRFPIAGTGLWYECMSKQVDEWKSTVP